MSKPNIETGGPALPITGTHEQVLEIGMSIRDYFAAKAMQIMWDAYDKGYCGLNNQDSPNNRIIAKGAYQMADAMLKAREAA